MNNQKTSLLKTQAAVRSGVLCSLFEVLPDYIPETKAILSGKKSVLKLKGGSVKRSIEFNKESIRESNKTIFPSITLNFLNEKGMVKKLAGKKATVVPLPSGLGAVAGLKMFMKLSAKLSSIMSTEYEIDTLDYQFQTKLLLIAALRGVCEVGMHDHWVRVKAQHIPEGILRINVGGGESVDYCAFINHRKDNSGNDIFRLITEVSQEFDALSRKKATANLTFESIDVAGDILRAKANAMEYLGLGFIRISGKISYIQGIFPLLDRFSAVMSEKV